MRRRSTFIPAQNVDYDPSQVKIQGRRVTFADLRAAREERLTFSFKELPTELVEALQKFYELHIRWVANKAYSKANPYVPAQAAGLHVFYTPRANSVNDRLCHELHQLFSDELKCLSPETSFSRPDVLSEQFASSAALQYYAPLPSLQQLVRWIETNICSVTDAVCGHDAALLALADYLDIDYDSIGHALIITAYWSKPPSETIDPLGQWAAYDRWNIAVNAPLNDRVEIGILNSAPLEEPAQIQLEGYLVVVGDDEQPKPTMFLTPSRHHVAQEQSARQTFSVKFDEPTGLHPKMRITFPSSLSRPEATSGDASCALHAYFTLPSAIFVDEYAFPTTDNDPLFTEAHNIARLRSISGERDLEVPDYVVERWGSAMLLELATPSHIAGSTHPWEVTIPLHLRYLGPLDGGQREVEVPWPVVFWACTTDEGTKFSTNPFDRVNLGYDGLFGSRVMFYHLEPKPQNNATLMEMINVPVLDTTKTSFDTIELLTLLLVAGGFLWLATKVIRDIFWDFNRPEYAEHRQKGVETKKRK